jgi:hypothetical protein
LGTAHHPAAPTSCEFALTAATKTKNSRLFKDLRTIRAWRGELARILLNVHRAPTKRSFKPDSTSRRIIMKTLIIKDLARTEQLGRTEMAAVRGGWKMGTPSYSYGDVKHSPSFPSYDSSIQATQSLVQMQDVVNATANGSAFLDNIHVHNDVSQNGTNKIIRN